jgi:DNA-binding transcriptional regulator GbsR (MarR family)
MCLKELQGWGLVELTHVMGDRRDHFVAEQDVWEMMTLIVEGRKVREIDPLIQTLEHCRDEAAADKSIDPDVSKRIAAMNDFVTDLSDWYVQVRKIPRPVIRKLMAMGAKVARVAS